MPQIEDTDIQPALQVQSAADIAWDDDTDVVVVGFGGAGASAAIEAVERGASVIAVDRFGGGGASAFSGGVFYACDTPIQKEAGFNDTPDAMYDYLDAEKAPVAPETLRRFCDGSSDDFAWVARHVPYSASFHEGKVAYPPEGKFLFYSGNERTKRFAAIARPSPRGHRAVGKNLTGNVFFAGLRKAAMDAGVKLYAHSPVRRLVIDADRNVIGVEVLSLPPEAARAHDRLYQTMNPQLPFRGPVDGVRRACRELVAGQGVPRLIRARAGVVLSAGGFANNPTMVARHRPDLKTAYNDLMRLASLGCDGSGMALGVSAGGHVDLMRNAYVGKTISPPAIFLNGILVNRQGRRFINEDAYSDIVGSAIAAQDDNGAAYLLCDRRVFWKCVRDSITGGMLTGVPALMNIFLGGTRRARTLRDLARKCGLSAADLETTVRDYNQRIREGADDPLGKLPANSAELDARGPYYAINMSLENKFSFHMLITLGGLKVDEATGHVIREDGSRVEGLYAAGRNAVGLCSGGYVSGMSLADLVFSGRRAARAMTQGRAAPAG
jgi:3-oxo-5alpha-steroid 4-dehydrogenase